MDAEEKEGKGVEVCEEGRRRNMGNTVGAKDEVDDGDVNEMDENEEKDEKWMES